MKLFSLPSALALATLSFALPAAEDHSLSKRDAYNPPRNQIYVQTFRNQSGSGQFSMLPMIQNPTQLTHVHLASLHINSDPKAITLNDNNPNDTIWHNVWSEVSQLQSRGVKVLMSIGGAAAGSYPRLCSGGANRAVINESYYMPLYYTLKYHKLDGVTLDIEERVQYTCPLALLQRFNRDFGTNFILTMAPVATELQRNGYGLGGFSYKTLDYYATSSSKPNGKLVNWYNPQFYNGWGDASTPNGYQSIIRNGWSASRVAIGVLDNPNDGGSGWFNLTRYRSTINSLRSTYGTSFGGVVGWEYWDAGGRDNLPQPYQWVAPVGASAFGTSRKRDGFWDDVEGDLEERQDGGAGLDPVSFGPAPYPQLMQRLEGLGALHIAAVRALNISRGDLPGALKILGLNLLNALEGKGQ